MPLIKNGEFTADPWRRVGDTDALPTDEPAIVSLARFEKERAALLARNAPLGILLKSNEAPSKIAADIARFSLIVIEFPFFKDGRGFSYGLRLRDQFGYTGELRATGHLLPDQALFLLRCGYDSFEVKDTAKLTDWQRGFSEISVFYQRSHDGRPTALALRHAAVPRTVRGRG